MVTFQEIQSALDARRPTLLSPASRTHAAVALILSLTDSGPQVLFVERSRHDGDPWSGDLGFPGGKVEKGEEGNPRLAAERETLEEIGIDLKEAQYLGRLDDIEGAHLPIIVSCFVYGAERNVSWKFNGEIREAFWFPLADLVDPARHVDAPVIFRDRRLVRPAIRLLGPESTVLWGITYRMVCQFLRLLGYDVGRETSF
jgi:8-oxo-dGTP pyrophosphatase MutT (NUDIX family)